MFWQILLGVVLAGIGLTALMLFFTKFLFPLPLSGTYYLRPTAAQLVFLEQQLRGLRWLRQMGMFRGRILVLSDDVAADQIDLLQALLRQGLADEITTCGELHKQIDHWEE